MIHVLDYKGNIIDFISQDDNAIIKATHHRNINERTETFDFTILSERAENMQDRNRIIIQDSNEQYREFIIEHISQDMDGYTEIETSASYLEDISTSVPYPPGKLTSMTTSQALRDVLKDTGWQVSDRTEYGGIRSTSWTSFQTRYEVLMQLCTTYSMIPDFYIEIGTNKVEGRYVVLKKRNAIFNGKEIVYGKDLLEMKRTVDMTEIKTALLASGPQKEDGTPGITLTVKDDEANNRYSLPGRYLWGIYSPESSDENMTESRLRTLATTELNKRKAAAISYEVKATDIKRYYPHEVIRLGDKIRIKNEDFVPSLYLEAEVIGEDYDLISGDSEYSFGEYKEYAESDLKKAFEQRLRDIQQKLNDKVSNINTIIQQTQAGNLEYFEKKIIKSSTPPTNPVNDMLWYDTSNPSVAVVRRYWNGKWLESTVEDVEQIGGITREKALFSELENTFVNLSIQHSRLLSDVYDVINSEYFVDSELKSQVQNDLDNTVSIFNQIKNNLDSMTPETATIGKLVDTQALFLQYRESMQTLYRSVETAKLSIDERFKLLQSQYTDEKFNDAMAKVADSIGGTWNAETGQLLADIPSQKELEDALKTYINGQDEALKSLISGEVDSKLTQTKNELSNSINAVSTKVDNFKVGGRNLLLNSLNTFFAPNNVGLGIPIQNADKSWTITPDADKSVSSYYFFKYKNKTLTSQPLEKDIYYTFSVDVKSEVDTVVELSINSAAIEQYQSTTKNMLIPLKANQYKRIAFTFKFVQDIDNMPIILRTQSTGARLTYTNSQIEQGTKATDWTPAPEDTVEAIVLAQRNAEDAAKKYADAQDNLRNTELKVYADGIVTAEENRAINDAKTKLAEAKEYASQHAANALYLAQQDIEPIRATQTKQSSDIKQLQDSILLKADKSEVTTLYDDSIKPLETQVNNNSATLKVQADKIDSKVSNEQYTADVNNVISKLNTAESQRTQLSNEINDRVTLKMFNDSKAETDKTLDVMQTQINQNGTDINQRATKEEFNASRKTLSKVVSDLTINTTTGLTLSYDENGNIQSSTVGPDGVKIKGDRVNITVNEDFKVMTAAVNNKVGKNEVVNSINVSNEGIAIDANKVGIRGGDGTTYLDIQNTKLLSRGFFDRTWGDVTDRPYCKLGIYDGHLIMQNETSARNLYLTEKGLSTTMAGNLKGTSGTLEFHFFNPEDNTEGVRLHSYYGVVYLQSQENRVYIRSKQTTNIETVDAGVYLRPYILTRPGVNEFSYKVMEADNASDTDGYFIYGEVSNPNGLAGSGIRFRKKGLKGETTGDYEPMVYATDNAGNANTGSFSAKNFYGDLKTRLKHLYIMADSAGGEIRATSTTGEQGNNTTYVPVRGARFSSHSALAFTNHASGGTYFGVGTDVNCKLYVTDNNGYNNGKPQYKDVVARNFVGNPNAPSSEKFKTNIEEWKTDATQIIRDLVLYEYSYKTDLDKRKHGVILERETPDSFKSDDAVNVYEFLSTVTKSLQEQIERNDNLEIKINKLEEQING